jgi:putative ABC transport system permease protein
VNRFDPPKLARRLLISFLRNDLVEEVEGDLEEKFSATLKTRSLFRARLNYWFQVINYLRPFALQKTKLPFLIHAAMLESYFKIGWRNMIKQRMYSSIKVGGFALGIAACFLIALFIQTELSYDKHLPKGNRIYRVVECYNNKGNMQKGVHLAAPAGPVFKQDYPEVVDFARINPVELFGAGNNDIRKDGQTENTYESGFVYADPSILAMFDLPMIYGNAATALSEPNSIVLTKRKADKYFQGEDPVGKIMIVNNDEKNPYKVGGIIADPLPNTHFQYDFLITLSGREFGKGEQTNWLQSNYPTYLLVAPGTDPHALERKFSKLGEKYFLPRLLEIGFPNAKEEIKNLSYQLQPVTDIYLNQVDVGDGLNHGDVRFVWLSGAVAAFILLLACINFVNLSTAKSANRAKEVGLRKVVGSVRSSIVNQFLTESVLFSFFAFVVGVLMAWALLPFFNQLVGKTILFPWTAWWFAPIIFSGAIVIGIFAGIYPSLYLSGFRPIEVLKGNVARGSRSGSMRSMLVVFQFTTSIVLIIGTFVVYRQMNFILQTKVGFDKEQVILIQGTNLLGGKIKTFKNELLTVRDVKSATMSDYLPIRGTKRNTNSFWNFGRNKIDPPTGAQFWRVDNDYIKTLGMKIVDGRDFSADMVSDSTAAIINQTMAKKLALKEPIGKQITNFRNWTVVGVVADFNFESLKQEVEPLCMTLGGGTPSIISVKVQTKDVANVVEGVSKTWKTFAPQQPIRYTFLDESYARMYEDVERMGKIFTTFAVLAIIVACLGLFGLSSFMVEQRSKEISIRLVLGATLNSIFTLLTRNFVKLVFVSFVIAAPLAWYLMDLWLQDFVYRTDISIDVFVYAASIALSIAVFTISFQSIRAGMVKAVNGLRSE